jgi:hypothetical protein
VASIISDATPGQSDRKAEEVLTPLGPVPWSGLDALRAFGREAEQLEYPCIDLGGFIVSGRTPAASFKPEVSKERNDGTVERTSGRRAPEEGDRTPGSGGPSETASGAPPHSVEGQLAKANVDLSELLEYHPRARVTGSSEDVVLLDVPVGLFAELPFRARLSLEVPVHPRARLGRSLRVPSVVPDIRAWSVWVGGEFNERPIRSHHSNPDGSICACLPTEWIRGVHSLRDYVAFCIVWIGKTLHDDLIGFYPGRQHYGPLDRVRRDRRAEYCGCGLSRRYDECCRRMDQARTLNDLVHDALRAKQNYMSELMRQGR